jgi:hypothetical protein
VGDVGVGEAGGESLPCLRLDLVRLADVQTPYFARWLLEDAQEPKDLLVSHPFVEVLDNDMS